MSGDNPNVFVEEDGKIIGIVPKKEILTDSEQ
jgi:predicted transcriptional regulator